MGASCIGGRVACGTTGGSVEEGSVLPRLRPIKLVRRVALPILLLLLGVPPSSVLRLGTVIEDDIVETCDSSCDDDAAMLLLEPLPLSRLPRPRIDLREERPAVGGGLRVEDEKSGDCLAVELGMPPDEDELEAWNGASLLPVCRLRKKDGVRRAGL